jgi:hypothetical protein
VRGYFEKEVIIMMRRMVALVGQQIAAYGGRNHKTPSL